MVIAIGRFDNICPGIELHAHLSEIVAKKTANAATDRRISPAHAFGKEQIAAFVHPCVRIKITWIEQCARQSRHQRRRGYDTARLSKMERQPEAAQARKPADRKLLDTCVLY